MKMNEHGTDRYASFLNVDLDVISSRPLDSFVRGLGKTVMILAAGKQGRRYSAHLELAASGYGQSPDRIILRFVTLIKKLPAAAKTAWAQASARTFDIGIQAGHETPNFQVSLKPATIAAITSIGAGLAITVYSPQLVVTTQAAT